MKSGYYWVTESEDSDAYPAYVDTLADPAIVLGPNRVALATRKFTFVTMTPPRKQNKKKNTHMNPDMANNMEYDPYAAIAATATSAPSSSGAYHCAGPPPGSRGKGVIRDVIHRLRSKADNLQTLIDMLPEKPTPEQDDALWAIAVDIRE